MWSKLGFLTPSAIALWIVVSPTAYATPYWSEADYQRSQANHRAIGAGEPVQLSPLTVDQYALLYEYVQICGFLASMQEDNPLDPDFGGMHEGETPELWAIVETDNTQEAIRVWSAYGLLSGDPETYRENISAAWAYTMNYPAYSEEGTDSDYYRVHNCGWALVAESRYRQVYGDSSYLWYADSCAAYIETHRLAYTGVPSFYTTLHPLVEGWAAGTLYDYGIERGDLEAATHALEVGTDVQDWIAENPNRLSNNEAWAMSGGTALWGVCRSVFAADPIAGQNWLPAYLPYMDTYAGYGQWNNSWNVWYAHAYHASAAVLEDSLYTGFAFALVDTLLDADTDNDGGIMATSTDPPTMDQSWVSCYLDYMGLEALINQSPALDASALGFLLPVTSLPLAQGEPQEIRVLVANAGVQPFGNVEAVICGGFSGSVSTYLEFADVDTLTLGPWIPSAPGFAQLTMTCTPGGSISMNDTASIWVEVLGWGTISGAVSDLGTGQPLAANLKFYREDFPPEQPLYVTSTDPLNGFYEVSVMEGNYRVVVDPQIPYTDREIQGIEVFLGGVVTVDFELTAAPVLLVDDDGGSIYEQYYSLPLAQAGYDAFYWEISQDGIPLGELSLFPALIWFTGNEVDSALTAQEQASLSQYLEAGGSLLMSGQNIAQGLTGEPFLSDYLGCSLVGPNSGQMQVFGMEGDPVTSGQSLLFAGAGGAGNQNSTDMIEAVLPAELAMYYPGGMQPVAAVHRDEPYKLLFLAFGLEGASGLGGSSSREEFLQAVLQWFEIPAATPQLQTNTPANYSLMQLFPNPFNAGVQIIFALPQPIEASISIYNILGEQVSSRQLGLLPAGRLNLHYSFGGELSSGTYFFRLQAQDFSTIAQGILMK